MIETIFSHIPGIGSSKGYSTPQALDQSRSPFQDLVSQELSPTKPLDAIFLNFLIKTIQSICLRSFQGDLFSHFPSIPFLPDGSSRAMPWPVKPSAPNDVPPADRKSSSQEFDKIITQVAGEFGVDPGLIKAVIAVESNGNPRAVSPAGAQGLMQLMPRTAAELGVTDPFDPVQNIRAGTRYLSQLQNRYQGDLKLTLAAYNWGMGNLEKKPESLPQETRHYILQVEKRYLAYLNSSSTA